MYTITGAFPYGGWYMCIYRTRDPALATHFTSSVVEKKKEEEDGKEGGKDLWCQAAN